MTLIFALQSLVDGQSLKMFRVKELIMLILGYTINDLASIWAIISNKCQQIIFKTPLHKLVDQLSNATVKRYQAIPKQSLAQIFSTVLKVLHSSPHILKHLFQEFQEFVKFFFDLLNEGFSFYSINCNKLDLLAKIQNKVHQNVKIMHQKYKISKQFNQTKPKLFHPKYLQGLIQVQKENQAEQKLDEICEICCFSLASLQKQLQDQANYGQTVSISKCNHRFHYRCIFKLIDHHMSESSSILYQDKLEEQISKIQVPQDSLTLIKCPNYELCSAYLYLSQLHEILLKQNSQKSISNLQRLYSIAFNDYINSRSITTFCQLKQSFQKQNLQYKNSTSLLNLYIFFCNTKGCNAIYEIDKKLLQSNCNQQPSNRPIQNFTCLSCHSSYCLKCFSQIHPTMTCKEFSISSNYLPQDRQLEKFIKTLRRPYMKCPKCHFYVDNWRGCSTITCRCGIRFCYKCGSTQCPYAKCLKEMQKDANKNNQEKQI